MVKEIWDAYDKDSNKLGFDLIRGEPIKKGAFHIVVEIYSITKNNEVLITQRHSSKSWPLKWEITGGSILKGETIKQGAIRELKEETGIEVEESKLHFVHSYVSEDVSSIYYCYIVFINKDDTKIKLQENETIAYRYLPYNEFKQFIQTGDYVNRIKDRFCKHVELYDAIINQRQNR